MTKALQRLNWSRSAVLPAQSTQVLEKEDQDAEEEDETGTVNFKNGTNLAIGDISDRREERKEEHE